jgi:DNA-binding GntR family transcriptional regulator
MQLLWKTVASPTLLVYGMPHNHMAIIEAIIEALESRDADKASQLVREHTMRLHEHVRRSWTRPATVSRSQVESS